MADSSKESYKKHRLGSIDVFRGFTIISMIIVNSPPFFETDIRSFEQLKHAEWNGFTFADSIFPVFVFIMGISIVLSLAPKLTDPDMDKRMIVLKILKRAIILFLLGLLQNIVGFGLFDLQIPGILQTLAVVYLVTGLLYLFFRSSLKILSVFAVSLLLCYWGLVSILDAQNILPGILESGKNMPDWIISFHPGRQTVNLVWPSAKVLASINPVVTAISGIIAGNLLMDKNISIKRKAAVLTLSGVLAVGTALLWNNVYPVNKKLWSGSFTLLTAGIAVLELALFVILVDLKFKNKSWKVMTAFGKNAVFAFLLHGVLKIPFYFIPLGNTGKPLRRIYWDFFNGNLNLPTGAVSLLWAVLFTLVCFIPVYFLDMKKKYLRI